MKLEEPGQDQEPQEPGGDEEPQGPGGGQEPQEPGGDREPQELPNQVRVTAFFTAAASNFPATKMWVRAAPKLSL